MPSLRWTSLRRTSLRRTLPFCLLGAAAIPLLAGCGGGGGDNGGGGNSAPSVSAPAANGLIATLTENSSAVSVGGRLTYTLTLNNPTGASITVPANSATQPSVYLTVTDPTGVGVYAPIPPPPLNTAIIAPGQSLTETVSVSVFTMRGAYNATAVFSFGGAPPGVTVGPLAVTAQ
ncbi:MAG: hypothetical protein M3Y13_02840 [Armatimonadota bacterium]|nr:hypothetical protein [Armatimonadota bacterium]